jgi:hypothetical protein
MKNILLDISGKYDAEVLGSTYDGLIQLLHSTGVLGVAAENSTIRSVYGKSPSPLSENGLTVS